MPATRQAVISPDLLERVGRSLYGNNWITALARDLEMSRRSIEYMKDGDRGIHAGIVRDLLDIIAEHDGELHEVAKALRRAIG
jgi:hypothetical protein